MTHAGRSSLVELRVLDGPNLYFPRAAVKLTVDLTSLGSLTEADARGFARRIGLAATSPGAPGSGLRQRFAARALASLVRHLAAEAGTRRLALRVRPTADQDSLVVAFPWRHRNRAETLGRLVADILDSLPAGDVDSLVSAAARELRATEPGPGPETLTPTVPVVAVTGTNGKTTTARMIAHIGRCAGWRVGWSSTDGVYGDGVLVEAGDYSGPGGAAKVLGLPGVQLGVLETARGGILLRGMGVSRVDVAVVTNVSADHLGLQGIDTLDQLAEVKSVVPRVARRGGWVVLNGDDPRVLAMRAASPARPWVFTPDQRSPAIRDALSDGGRATTVIDASICMLGRDGDPLPLLPVVDVPMTLSGLSRFNVENALAAASAALALGLPAAVVAAGLRSFEPGPQHNPGRLNVYSLRGLTVVLDLAHNEAGLTALLEVVGALCSVGSRTLLGLGTAGDRTDDQLSAMGELAARGCDEVAIVQKLRYLRGRSTAEMTALYRQGAAVVGATDIPSYDDELTALTSLVNRAQPGDVVALMCQQDREQVAGWLGEQGATVDDPATLREKVLVASRSRRGAAEPSTRTGGRRPRRQR